MLSLLLAFVLGQGDRLDLRLEPQRSVLLPLVHPVPGADDADRLAGDVRDRQQHHHRLRSALGALALIRFRNVLKDTRDTVFVFIALVTGMAVGSQRYMTAIVGTIAMSLAALYLNMTSFGSQGKL